MVLELSIEVLTDVKSSFLRCALQILMKFSASSWKNKISADFRVAIYGEYLQYFTCVENKFVESKFCFFI